MFIKKVSILTTTTSFRILRDCMLVESRDVGISILEYLHINPIEIGVTSGRVLILGTCHGTAGVVRRANLERANHLILIILIILFELFRICRHLILLFLWHLNKQLIVYRQRGMLLDLPHIFVYCPGR